MNEFIRQYGRYVIAVLAFIMVMGILTSSAIFPQYGLLSYLGSKSHLEADRIDGDYSLSKDEDGNDLILYSNDDIQFDLMSTPELNKTYHINYNKGKSLYPNSCLLKTDKNADITILSVKNNNGENANEVLSSDMIHSQVIYSSYDYTNPNDIKDNYKNDDGTLIFYEPGIYSITVEAKWTNNNNSGHSTRQKIFKINILN